MITPEKIDEWIREVEERPSSSSIIVRYIANRLSDLARRNEELLAENIQLRTGKKIEEYETRVANLEYQVDLLKRQLGGDVPEGFTPSAAVDTVSVIIYNAQGEVLRLELERSTLASRPAAGRILAASFGSGDPDAHREPPRLLVTGAHEELLFLFDSGRIVAMPVTKIPAAGSGELDWKQAYLEEPRGGEELAAILPVGRMSLSDSCVQVSRRGCVKKMMRTAFEAHVSKNFVGTGVKLTTDRTCGLTLCVKDDRFVLVSQEGWLLTLDAAKLSYAIEETIKLSTTDHIMAGFAVGQKKSVAFVTQTGKVIHREAGWLEPAVSSRSRGQPVFTEDRRKGGVRLVGAAAVDEDDWCAVLDSTGGLTIYKMGDLLGAGTVPSRQGDVLAVGIF